MSLVIAVYCNASADCFANTERRPSPSGHGHQSIYRTQTQRPLGGKTSPKDSKNSHGVAYNPLNLRV